MKSRHIPMTFAEFQRLDQELGWKYEYFGGCAHISPREIPMRCAMPVGPRDAPDAPPAPCPPEPVAPSDADALVGAYLAAFADGIEYCDWPAERVRKDARSTIDGFFAGHRGAPLAASRVARGREHGLPPLLGALLIVEAGDRLAHLDLLFVVPEARRHGFASAMAASALTALHQMGFHTLESRFLLGNRASRAWHHRFGFTDRPDALSARAILAHARHRLERAEHVSDPDPAALSNLAQEVLHWEMEVKRLDEEDARRWEARQAVVGPRTEQEPRS